MLKVCLNCNVEFEPNRSRQKFCSRECFGKYRSKTGIGVQSRRDIVKICKHCGKKYVPTRHNRQRQKYCSSGCCVLAKRGASSIHWKGGITKLNQLIRVSLEHRWWARDVKERDGFRCQICGVKGGKLCSHHVLAFALYPQYRFDVDNGVCLCLSCHIRLEKGLRREDVLFVKMNRFLGYRMLCRVEVLL